MEPMQPPRMFGQMMKKRSVSMGLPGPTSFSHQPGFPVTGWMLAACWSPVSAWQTRMAFDLAALRVPYVLYAIVSGAMSCPDSSFRGSLSGKSTERLDGLNTSGRRAMPAEHCSFSSPVDIAVGAPIDRAPARRTCGLSNTGLVKPAHRNFPGATAHLATCLTWLQAGRPNHHDRNDRPISEVVRKRSRRLACGVLSG